MGQNYSPRLPGLPPLFPIFFPFNTLACLFWAWCLLYGGVTSSLYSTILSELELLDCLPSGHALPTFWDIPPQGRISSSTFQAHQVMGFGMNLGAVNLVSVFFVVWQAHALELSPHVVIKITQNFEISSYQQGFGDKSRGRNWGSCKIAFEIKTNNTNLPVSFTFSLFCVFSRLSLAMRSNYHGLILLFIKAFSIQTKP